jgi:hypothetical protein
LGAASNPMPPPIFGKDWITIVAPAETDGRQN